MKGLKVFEKVLKGMKIIVYTDHFNLLYAKYVLQRMVQWKLIVEKFVPNELRHIVGGEDNVVVDSLSR